MTDLEITRLCAEAMGHGLAEYEGKLYVWSGKSSPRMLALDELGPPYDPLHDDAQAMALVKKFPISIMPIQMLGQKACIYRVTAICGDIKVTEDANLNRAICECVANMQTTHTTKQPSASPYPVETPLLRS